MSKRAFVLESRAVGWVLVRSQSNFKRDTVTESIVAATLLYKPAPHTTNIISSFCHADRVRFSQEPTNPAALSPPVLPGAHAQHEP